LGDTTGMQDNNSSALSDQGVIVDNLQESIITTDAAGIVTSWNKGAERLFGYGAHEMIGRHFDVCYQANRSTVDREVVVPLKRTGALDITAKMARRSGEIFDGHVLASLITKPDGTVNGMVGSISNVTEKLRAENALKSSEARLSEALRIAQIGHFEFEVATETTWWSEKTHKLFDIPVEDGAPGWSRFLELLPPDDRPEMAEAVRAAIEDGTAFSVEHGVLRKNQPTRTFVSEAEVFCDADGNVVRLAGTNRDITERKRIEATLREARDTLAYRVEQRTRELQTTLETLVEGVITIDENGTIESLNPSAETLFGYATDEVIGKNVNMLMPASDAVDHDQNIRNYLKTGDAKIIGIGREVIGRNKDGTVFPMRLGIGEMEINGERRFVGTVHDITDRKNVERELVFALEKAENANRAKSDFLSSMSHELRTPMNAILGYSQLLENAAAGPLTEGQTEFVEEILRSGHHMLALIGDLLDLSSIENGDLKIELQDLDPDTLVVNCVNMVETVAAQKGIALINRVRAGALPRIRTDALRFRQALLNLLSNAIKYNDAGEEVIVASRIVQNGRLKITVTDTGDGIPAEQRDRVFEPFDRLGAENSNIPGTGIGLSVSKQLLERMDGRIGLEDAPGGGSTFWVEVPLAVPSP
jgi:PAS domain S-box-containing protein